MNHRKIIYVILAVLILLDLVVSIVGFFFPEAWNSYYHGAVFSDDQALLKRCAANWFAFFVLQTIAIFNWEKAIWWLVLIAGCRLGDCLTDITCMIYSTSISINGIVGFTIAGIGNLVIGIYFIKRYLHLNRSNAG